MAIYKFCELKISILFPLFKSELCLVKFESNQNAHVHFNGVNHQNRVNLLTRIKFEKENPKGPKIWCEICCCEINTEKMLEIHRQSPKHLKKAAAVDEITKLKSEYLKNRANNNNTNVENTST